MLRIVSVLIKIDDRLCRNHNPEMRTAKKVGISIIGIVVIHQILYRGYDMLSNNDRRFIRRQCELLRSNTPLNLFEIQQSMDNEKSRAFTVMLQDGWKLPSDFPTDYKSHLDKIDPNGIKSLVFHAEGFNRERLEITAQDGLIVRVRCGTGGRQFER